MVARFEAASLRYRRPRHTEHFPNNPAREIEEFFEDLAKLGGTPEREELQRVFDSHGLELVGPPLSIE
jgi:hypothetical protein